MECPVCMMDMEAPVRWCLGSGEETPLEWCWECVEETRTGHYKRWAKSVKEADCAAALRRLIGKGPPMTLADAIEGIAQPMPPDWGEVKCDGHEAVSGKLVGSLETEADRLKYWDELKTALAVFEAVEAAEAKEKAK